MALYPWMLPLAGVAAGSLAWWLFATRRKMSKNLPAYGGISMYCHMRTLVCEEGQGVLDYLLHLAQQHGPIYRER